MNSYLSLISRVGDSGIIQTFMELKSASRDFHQLVFHPNFWYYPGKKILPLFQMWSLSVSHRSPLSCPPHLLHHLFPSPAVSSLIMLSAHPRKPRSPSFLKNLLLPLPETNLAPAICPTLSFTLFGSLPKWCFFEAVFLMLPAIRSTSSLSIPSPSSWVIALCFLAALCGMWDLSSPTRDWTHASCSGSAES